MTHLPPPLLLHEQQVAEVGPSSVAVAQSNVEREALLERSAQAAANAIGQEGRRQCRGARLPLRLAAGQRVLCSAGGAALH